MRKIQIVISSDLCIRLTWNLTGSCGQQQGLREWSRMVVKQFQDANLTLNQHVSSLCKLMHFHTRSLHHICPALSDCIAITVATLFVQSRLDYANCLCTIHRQPTYINYSVHKIRCLVSYSLAIIANTCQLACGFLLSTGSQSVNVLISSWP